MSEPAWLYFLRGRRLPVILQSEAAECGLASLAMVAGYHGFRIDLPALRQRHSVSVRGQTLADLMTVAKDLRLAPRPLRVNLEQLGELKRPAILHWDMDHFVVLEQIRGRQIRIVDPAIGRRTLSRKQLSRHFTGVALELSPAEGFRRRRESVPLPLSSLFSGARGLRTTLANILGLSLALQVFVLVGPLFTQIVIDDIAVSNDRSLLTVLGVAFLLIAALRVCISGIRGWLIIALGASLQFGWVTRLFHHLMRLPLAYFERRHMGDIISRFDSIHSVEALVAHAVVEAVVDGILAITTLCVLFFYNVQLALIAIAAVLLYIVLRTLMFDALWVATHDSLVIGARANSLFMETVRAILPLKNFGRETMREAIWQNRKVEALNASVRVSRLQLLQHLAHTGIFAIENVIILWIGARIVLSGGMSIGMLVAFISYKSHFASRSAALVDKGVDFRLLRLHLDRIADIALAETEPSQTAQLTPLRKIRGALEARDLWFRYSDRDAFVIRALDLKVRSGECIAITGPSGVGKSTLVKLLMGLMQPSAGTILVDGIELQPAMLSNFRRQAAAVMQDDTLMSGSLADNITLFDPEIDEAWLESCTRRSAMHEEIMRMPMGYSTLVGDMGSALSGGQKQRILLARALYARPRILFLDEATSHTDPFAENRIYQNLRALHITCVLIAHRHETLAVADRVIQLSAATGAEKIGPVTV